MTKKRTRLKRAAFHARTGFTIFDRESGAYKYQWRRFKKDTRRGK